MASDRRSCGHQFRLGRASAIKAGAEPATLVVGGAGWTARPAHEVTILMQARLGESGHESFVQALHLSHLRDLQDWAIASASRTL